MAQLHPDPTDPTALAGYLRAQATEFLRALRLHRRWTKHLLESGRPAEARPHALAWWRARPFSPKAAWAVLRTARA